MTKIEDKNRATNLAKVDMNEESIANEPFDDCRSKQNHELLADTSLTEAEKEEFLCALWGILVCMWGAGYDLRTFESDETE